MALLIFFMSEFATSIDRGSDVTNPSFWGYIIYVSISIMLIITIGKIVLNLAPERSEFAATEKVANESYRQYSHRLDTISKTYAKEIESMKKGN